MTQYEQDVEDLWECADVGNWLTRCHGGRLIIEGYVCVHCGSDEPERDCADPMKDLIK